MYHVLNWYKVIRLALDPEPHLIVLLQNDEFGVSSLEEQMGDDDCKINGYLDKGQREN